MLRDGVFFTFSNDLVLDLQGSFLTHPCFRSFPLYVFFILLLSRLAGINCGFLRTNECNEWNKLNHSSGSSPCD